MGNGQSAIGNRQWAMGNGQANIPLGAAPIAPQAASFEPEVGVPLWFLAGVDVGWRDEPRDPGFNQDVPLFLVDQMVVMGTQQRAVLGAGGPAV